MKRLLCIFLVALCAGPLVAADGTWTNASTDGRWDTAGNWTGGVPGNGNTATFDDADDCSVPTGGTGEPGAGSTVNFVFASGFANFTRLGTDLYSAGGAVGNVTVEDPGATIQLDLDVAGNVSVYPGGTVICEANRSIAGTVTLIGSGSGDYAFLDVAAGTTTVAGVIDLQVNSQITVRSEAVLDANGGITVSELGASVANAGTIQGCLNAGACTLAWSGTGTITVDETGTLNLGTTADNDQTVDIAANVTIGDSFRCLGFTLTSGTLTGAGKIITVGAGGYTRTAGDLNALGTLNVTFAVTTVVCKHASSPLALGTITIDDDVEVTLSGDTYFKKLSGGATATVNVATSKRLFIRVPAANFWDFDGTCTGATGTVFIYGTTANAANAKIVDVGTADFDVLTANHTITLSAGLACDNLMVHGYGAGTTGTVVSSGPLTVATNVVLGNADNTNGVLTMAAGETNSIGGTVAKTGTGTGHGLNLAGTVTFGGNVTLAGITPDFGSAVIEASGDLTIEADGSGTVANTDGVIFANGNTLTVNNIDWATTSAPLICVSCTPGTGEDACGAGVEFQEPQRMTMGCGF